MPQPSAYEPAHLGRRLAAMLYDGLLLLAMWIVTALYGFHSTAQQSLGHFLPACSPPRPWLLCLLLAPNRRDPGYARAWRIRVVNTEGISPSWQQIALRLLTAFASFGCFGAGYLWLYIGKTRQTWHDLASNTYVVHIPR